jgi:ribosomal protein S10
MENIQLFSNNLNKFIRAEYVVPLYKSGISAAKIAKIIGCDNRLIKKILKLSNTPIRLKKYTVNSNFFNDDSRDVMYWLGMLAADGNVYIKQRLYCLTLKLASYDENHIEKFKKAIGSTAKIEKVIVKNSMRNPIWKDSYTSLIRIYNKKIINDLIEIGIAPNKSFTFKFPEYALKSKFVCDFCRGYIDGDGSYFLSKSGLRTIIYGNKQFLEEFAKVIHNNVPNISLKNLHKNRTIWALEYSGKDAIKLINWLYSDIENNQHICLDRKYIKIKQCLQ